MDDKLKLVLTVVIAVALAGVAYHFRDYNFTPYVEAVRAKLHEWWEWLESLRSYVQPWYDWVQSWFKK